MLRRHSRPDSQAVQPPSAPFHLAQPTQSIGTASPPAFSIPAVRLFRGWRFLHAHLESYAYGISVPVLGLDEFFGLLVRWNCELNTEGIVAVDDAPIAMETEKAPLFLIQSENPLEQIWSRLRHMGSMSLARRVVGQRAGDEGLQLSTDQLERKAEGLAYAVRNATDYFRTQTIENLSQRVLSRYYGSLAFAFAEMLATPHGPETLADVESMTKFGHGLYTVDGVEGGQEAFAGLMVGVIASGFFPHWMKFLGHDVSGYPAKKPKSEADLTSINSVYVLTIERLFSRIPELADLFAGVSDRPPSWLVPNYDNSANEQGLSAKRIGKTYITLTDPLGRIGLDDVVKSSGPLSQVQHVKGEGPGVHFRAMVTHPSDGYWHQSLSLHRSPFTSAALVLPLFRDVQEFRAITVALMYGLSIVVRYRPSVWRRIQEGDLDHYRVLIESFLDVVERVLPEEFLGAITGREVYAHQPGGWF